MSTKALYAGSFDPFTNGHLDILTRACNMFDFVVIGIGINRAKPGLFTPEERARIIKSICKTNKKIKIEIFEGLTAVAARNLGCKVLVRGLRDSQDFGYEMQMAHMNKHLDMKIETVFIPGMLQYSEISSSLVKEVAALGGNVKGLLPDPAYLSLMKKIKSNGPIRA